MGTLKKDFKYKLVKNFLTKKELEIGSYYLHLKHKRNETEFDFDQSNNADPSFYGDCFIDTLMMKKLNLMEKETGLKLFPTYSFSRVYTYNAELKKHKDRPSCEVSVTVMWDSDGTDWPIFIENNSFNMQPGDGVIYLGCEVEHWREHFTGDYHIQSFMHYVDKNGPYKDYKYDKRTSRQDPTVI